MAQYREYYLSLLNTTGCEICNRFPPLDELVVHHLRGYRVPERAQNLLLVCRSCHARIHHGSDGYEEYSAMLSDHNLSRSTA